MKKMAILLAILCMVLVGCDTGGSGGTGVDTLPTVKVTEKTNYFQIEPVGIKPTTCLIFYPGAMIEPADYINPLQQIAAQGNRVLILKVTMGIAIMNVQKASRVMRDFSDIKNWVVGGHSLGGVAAVKAILNAPSSFKGLVLFASYPDSGDDLSSWKGAALSISAENDGLTTADEIEASKQLLPTAVVVDDMAAFPASATTGKTIFYEIEGGNHAQFGDYGVQENDGQATISKEDQHNMIEELVTSFFKINNW